ncbi:MAG: hypothetical protein MRY74_09060 [Neomegalonema sp.]|nr:hypothetical protein [Neomegalonema sp.]
MKFRMTHAALGAAALMSLSIEAAHANPVDNVCLYGGRSEAVCKCASDQLKVLANPADYELYSKTAGEFLILSSSGMKDGKAWKEAIAKVAAETGMATNVIRMRIGSVSRSHRSAMGGC